MGSGEGIEVAATKFPHSQNQAAGGMDTQGSPLFVSVAGNTGGGPVLCILLVGVRTVPYIGLAWLVGSSPCALGFRNYLVS